MGGHSRKARAHRSAAPQESSTQETRPSPPESKTHDVSRAPLGAARGGSSAQERLPEPRPTVIQAAARLPRQRDPHGANAPHDPSRRRPGLSRLPDLSRLGIEDAPVHQSPPESGSRPSSQTSGDPRRRPTTTRTVSRVSVNVLPLQLQRIVTETQIGEGQQPSPSPATRDARYRPRTYAELVDANPLDPRAQFIVNSMNRIAECHHMHLRISMGLDRIDPSSRPGFEDTLRILERAMRSDQDNIRELERQAGLFETPRIL